MSATGSTSRLLWYLKRFPIFGDMSESELEAMSSHMMMRPIGKGEPISKDVSIGADKVYFIKTGVLKLTVTNKEGKESILAFLKPGDIFGELAGATELMGPDQELRAHEECVVCSMSREDFDSMLESKPELAYKITKLAGFKLNRIYSRLKNLLFKSAEARVAATLLELSRDYGVDDNRGTIINLRLTHQDIADLIGATRETVTHALASLRGKGFIITEKKRIILINKAELENVA